MTGIFGFAIKQAIKHHYKKKELDYYWKSKTDAEINESIRYYHTQNKECPTCKNTIPQYVAICPICKTRTIDHHTRYYESLLQERR